MWPILHSWPKGLPGSYLPPLTTLQEIPLQALNNRDVSTPQLGISDTEVLLLPITSTTSIQTLYANSQISTPHANNEVVYDSPLDLTTSSTPPRKVPDFAQTASGHLANINDFSLDSSDPPRHGINAFIIWLKKTYFVAPWIYIWISILLFLLFIWIGFVTVFFFLLNGRYLPERSAVELVTKVLTPHSSSHKVRRDLSLVNISAVPVIDGTVWDKVPFDIFGPTETLQIPYVFKISLGDIITPGSISDDWDLNIIRSMLSELEHYTVFDRKDMYSGMSNYDDMFCYHHYAHHYLHRASTPRAIFNYTQWEHCPTPPSGSSKTYAQKYAYFSSNDPVDPESYYFKLFPSPAKKSMLTETTLIYSAHFISQLSIQGYDFWKDNVDLKSVWGTKDWQVQGNEALFRACIIPRQMIFLNKTVQQTSCLGLARIKDLNTPNIPTFERFKNWQQFTKYTEDNLNNMLKNGTYNSSHSSPEGWLVWPLNINGCHARFLNNMKGFRINRPDPRYTETQHSGVVTTYSVGKLCLEWLQHSTLDEVKEHLSLLSDDTDLQDFLLGPRKPPHKHFLYTGYSELWKVSQKKAAELLHEINRINLEKSLAVVDNGRTTLSSRMYSLSSIVSSAIDIIQSDMSLSQHRQSTLRSIMLLSWTLQTLQNGHVPWKHLNMTDLLLPYNLTHKQKIIAAKDATYTMLNIEHLEKLPFTVVETPSADWIIHGFISLPISTFHFKSCLKHFQVGRYEALGERFLHEAWFLPFDYRCRNGETGVFLSGTDCKNTFGHSLVCREVTLHGACNASKANLACYLKGSPAAVIHPTFILLSNGSYLMLNDQGCCGMRPGVPYVVTVSRVVTCCTKVLFPPAHTVRGMTIWPSIDTSNVNFNRLSRLKALLFQEEVSLTSARETFDLQVAMTSSEIQSLLRTNNPQLFVELVHRIFNASNTTGVVHFFKVIASGLLNSFQTVFGGIPCVIFSVVSIIVWTILVILFLVVGILSLLLLLCNGCSTTWPNGNGTTTCGNVS